MLLDLEICNLDLKCKNLDLDLDLEHSAAACCSLGLERAAAASCCCLPLLVLLPVLGPGACSSWSALDLERARHGQLWTWSVLMAAKLSGPLLDLHAFGPDTRSAHLGPADVGHHLICDVM